MFRFNTTRVSPGGREQIAIFRGAVLLALLLLSLSATLVTVGQENLQEKNLIDRLADGVSAKEPTFRLVSKFKARGEDISNLLGWKSDDDFVSVTFYEYTSPAEAALHLQATIKAPVSVISEPVKLNGLGDEAYIIEHRAYSKPGSTSLFFRRANVMVSLSASSPYLAKRFAEHLLNEI